MNPRTVAVVTGTRAEYGLLYWLMKEIQYDSDLELQVLVTGMHLSPEFGLTWKEIQKDGFSIAKKIEMLLSSDTSIGIGKSIGLATIGFAEAWDELNPDIALNWEKETYWSLFIRLRWKIKRLLCRCENF